MPLPYNKISISLHRNLAFMSFGHNNKVILQIHTISRHTRSHAHTLTLSKEKSSSISQFHPREIDTKTTVSTSSKSTERTLGCGTLVFPFEPTGRVETEMDVSKLFTRIKSKHIHMGVGPKVFISVHGVGLCADCCAWRDEVSIECCAALGYYSRKTTGYCTVQA
jgi:hypothetical protein